MSSCWFYSTDADGNSILHASSSGNHSRETSVNSLRSGVDSRSLTRRSRSASHGTRRSRSGSHGTRRSRSPNSAIPRANSELSLGRSRSPSRRQTTPEVGVEELPNDDPIIAKLNSSETHTAAQALPRAFMKGIESWYGASGLQFKDRKLLDELAKALPNYPDTKLGRVPRTNDYVYTKLKKEDQRRDALMQKIQAPIALTQNGLMLLAADRRVPTELREVALNALKAATVAYLTTHDVRKKQLLSAICPSFSAAIKDGTVKPVVCGKEWIPLPQSDFLKKVSTVVQNDMALKEYETKQKSTNKDGGGKWQNQRYGQNRQQPYRKNQKNSDFHKHRQDDQQKSYPRRESPPRRGGKNHRFSRRK